MLKSMLCISISALLLPTKKNDTSMKKKRVDRTENKYMPPLIRIEVEQYPPNKRLSQDSRIENKRSGLRF